MLKCVTMKREVITLSPTRFSQTSNVLSDLFRFVCTNYGRTRCHEAWQCPLPQNINGNQDQFIKQCRSKNASVLTLLLAAECVASVILLSDVAFSFDNNGGPVRIEIA